MRRLRFMLAASAALAPMIASAQWLPFEWVAAPALGSDKAAIVAPVALDGAACRMQLDTGAPTSVLYRMNLPERLGPTAGKARLTVADVRIGDQGAPRTFDLMYDPRPGGQPAACDGIAGTLGNDVVAGGALVLDLPHARYRIDRSPTAAPSAGAVHVLDMALFAFPDTPKTQPSVGATLAGGRAVRLLLDTGSALMALNVFEERDWLALVGLDATAHASAFSVPRWGAMVTCYKAPTQEPVSLGTLALPAGTIATHCADPRGVPPSAQGALYGLVGLAPFLDRRITLDYAAGKFIVEPSGEP